MNLMLLNSDSIENNIAKISGRQFDHLTQVQRLTEGDFLNLGEINGTMGRGKITTLTDEYATITLELGVQPPKPLPITVILALPRPKMLRRVLQTIAAMGVKNIYLINSTRVEKSFWQSPFLQPQAIEEQLILGLEQAKDTILPSVHLRKLFKPFVEDELTDIVAGSTAIIAHPGAKKSCPINLNSQVTLAIGPEGGFIPYEVTKLSAIGFDPMHLGPRILRVETAVPALLGRLFPV